MPKGRKAEDGRIDSRYRMTELTSPLYSVRTRRNVLESDGTVIFALNAESPRSQRAKRHGAPEGRRDPCFTSTPETKFSLEKKAQQLGDFVDSQRIDTLNVAGSRESQEPGVYQFTLDLLRRFWQT